MPRCDFCKKKNSILLECKACSGNHCPRCVDLSVHECKKTEEYVNEKRKSLETALIQNKTEVNKRLSF